MFFRPSVDNKIIFQNYIERAEKGLISKVPALISDTSNEQSSLIAYPIDNLTQGPNKTEVDRGTLNDFICPAFNSSNVREFNNLTTYRYQYAGNYSNLTPFSWMGAYHGAHLPMIFGSYNLTGGATDFQKQVAETMQDYVLAFLEDPKDGLKSLTWLPGSSRSGVDSSIVRFRAGDVVVQSINASDVDVACLGRGHYNSHP